MKEQEEAMRKIQLERQEWEDKLQAQRNEARIKQEKIQLLKELPQLRNINQDPQMSGISKYYMLEGINSIGKKQGDYEPNLSIAGVGIHKQQCTLDYSPEDRRTTIIPNAEDVKKFRVMVNGELIEAPRLLQHGDRVLIGLHHYFLFVDPHINFDEECDYEFALKEANKEQMSIAMADEGFEQKMKEMEEKIRREQEANEAELKAAKEKLEAEKQKQMQELKLAQEQMRITGDKEM